MIYNYNNITSLENKLLYKGAYKMKKIIALVLVFMFVLSISPMAASFSDMPNDWSTKGLEAAVKNGLLKGDNGKIRPNDPLTRAEMATIIVRAFGATNEADISEYTDVYANDWYYQAMSKAVAMGAFNGSNNKLNPQKNITRQEAFVVLARVFSLNIDKDVEEGILFGYKDGSSVAKWAKKEVSAIIKNGYVKGDSNGKINPENGISRAEFATVMDRMVTYYIDDAGVTTIPSDGNVMIRAGEINLDGIKSDKLIVIGDAAGKTNIKIKNAQLGDRLVIRGGENVSVQGEFNEIRVVSPFIKVDCSKATAKRIYGCKDSVIDMGITMGGM